MQLQSETWQRLLSLESRDAVTKWHRQINGRELNARRAKEINSSAKQAREFFRNSENANDSVKPLLTFYGVASLCRSAVLLLRRGSGEESLIQGHGLETVAWRNVLAGEVSAGPSGLGNLKIRTCSGLFADFLKETDNYMCMHVSSAAVDWGRSYEIPPLGEEISLNDLMSRVPDLRAKHRITGQDMCYVTMNKMTLTEPDGFHARVSAAQFESFKSSYADLGFMLTQSENWFDLRCDYEIFKCHTPQYMHTYVNKLFGAIPSLHLVKPFPSGARYSQMAITYLLSYFFGMLSRYFPTRWMALLSGERGDEIWPLIRSAQKYVDESFPELIVEFIHHILDRSEKKKLSLTSDT